MACPFFLPEQRLSADWPFPQRLPLGAGWSGVCTAASNAPAQPSQEELRTGCNLGYARTCARIPKERAADAVRFAISGECDGLVRILYAYERDYLPAGHGELVYDVASRRWQTAHSSACLLRMAECYIQVRIEKRVAHMESGEIPGA